MAPGGYDWCDAVADGVDPVATADAAWMTRQRQNGANQPAGDGGVMRLDRPDGDRLSIRATPYIWRDPATIPRRDWLYGRHLIRRYLSLTIAPGASGKSSLAIADAIALATGRNILSTPIHGGPYRVWVWNLEDPHDEIERRIAAVMTHYQIAADEIADRLHIDSGRDQELCLARQERDGVQIIEPVEQALIAELTRRRIDVLMIDPFVSSHRAQENDNGAIDAIAKTWGRIAERANCAIILVHHLRKLGGAEATAEMARGAIALVAAARSCRVLHRMTPDEAEKAGLESHRRHFRVSPDKENLAPPADQSDWFEIKPVELPNGDNVGVVVPWQWPNALDGLSANDLYRVQKAISGRGLRKDVQAKDWAGYTIGDVLGIDAETKAGKDRIRSLLRTWIASGALVVTEVTDANRTRRPTIDVGVWVTASASPCSGEVMRGDAGVATPRERCIRTTAPPAPPPLYRGGGAGGGAAPGSIGGDISGGGA